MIRFTEPKQFINNLNKLSIMTQEMLKTLEENSVYERLNGYTFEKWVKDPHWTIQDALENGEVTKEELQAEYAKLRTKPEIGDPCTVFLWSDRRGGTIVSVEFTKAGKPKRVGIRCNEYTQSGPYDGTCTCKDELYGDIDYYTLRKGGGWVKEGQPKNNGSVWLSIGHRHTYIDPNF